MQFYFTEYIYKELTRTNKTFVKKTSTKILFPLQLSYKLEFEYESYSPRMTAGRVSKEDIWGFMIRLYQYTDKLTSLWLTLCGAFFPFLGFAKLFTMVWKSYGYFAGFVSLPILFLCTDAISSQIILYGMSTVKKKIMAYIYHKQKGFQEVGVRWKVSDARWLTLELMLDYMHSDESKKDLQEDTTQLLPQHQAFARANPTDVERSRSDLL